MSIYSVKWNQTKDTYTREDITNQAPTIQVTTSNNETLYENGSIILAGFAKDADVNDVVTVRYTVNNTGAARPITTALSDGITEIPFSKTLTYKGGKLYDGATIVLDATAQGTAYSLQLYAEDDKSGKSAVTSLTFYAVPNRPPTLSVNAIPDKTGLVNSDVFTVGGSVDDPDGNAVTVEYAINGGSFIQSFGNGVASTGDYSFDVPAGTLKEGENKIVVRAKDSYEFTTSRTITLTKRHDAIPLKTSVARYLITPPTGSAKEILTWVQRSISGLSVEAEVSLTTNLLEAESFVPLTKSVTGAPVDAATVEDEFTLATGLPKERIVLKLVITGDTPNVDAAINLISGVLA